MLGLTAAMVLLGSLQSTANSTATSASAAATGRVSGKVELLDSKGRPHKSHAHAVVYLEDVPGPLPEGIPTEHTIRQEGKAFLPEINVVVKGSTVDFPNEDKFFHNVFSVSRPARFDLGLYRHGESKSVEFKRPGVVDIYCNIHPDMAAKVLVLDSGYFAQSSEDGSFSIEGVPAGTYPVRAWHANGDMWSGEVEVKAGGKSSLSISLKDDGRTGAHLRKDGTPYGRYK